MKQGTQTAVEIVPRNDSVDMLLTKAVEKGLPVETMEKLLGMRRELRAERAKEEFDAAMAEFQGECPIIEKRKQAYGYYYAPLESIVEQTKPLMKRCGFSFNFQTEMKEGKVSVVCVANHIGGHSKSSDPVELPVTNITTREGKQVMSAPQTVGSTITYGKRYAFINVFGIMTGDEDVDARDEREKKEKEESMGKQIEGAKEKLNGAINLNALKRVFSSLSGEVINNPEIVALKDSLKAKLEPKHESANISAGAEGGMAKS